MNQQRRAPLRTRTYWLMNELISLPIILAVLFAVKYFLFHYLGSAEWIATILFYLLVGYCIVGSFVEPFIKYKHWGYEINDKRITYYHGVYVKHQTIIPVVRIQHVTINEGPVAKRFGLVEIVIATASESHSLNGIPKEEGIELCNKLNEWIDQRVKEEWSKSNAE